MDCENCKGSKHFFLCNLSVAENFIPFALDKVAPPKITSKKKGCKYFRKISGLRFH